MEREIKDMYDLPIEAFVESDFWETTENPFLLAFGRVMKKKDLSMDCFDVLYNSYNQTTCVNIDLFITDYLKANKNDFRRDELDFLRPIMKNGLYYSSSWGDYV